MASGYRDHHENLSCQGALGLLKNKPATIFNPMSVACLSQFHGPLEIKRLYGIINKSGISGY